MGGRTATRLVDISDYTTSINRRDSLFHDLWGRDCYPYRDWLPIIEDEHFYSEQQWWIAGKEFGLNQREKRKGNDTTSLLPPETQAKVRYQYEVTATNARRLGVEKSFGKCQEPSLGKVRAQLERTISHHFSSRNRCLLFRKLRWERCTLPMECK